MGRKKQNEIYRYFDIDEVEKSALCLCTKDQEEDVLCHELLKVSKKEKTLLLETG